MVLQCGSNGLLGWVEWFANADRMVWQCESNCLQHRSNGFACGLNGFVMQIDNAD